jgi:hypothetical protein
MTADLFPAIEEPEEEDFPISTPLWVVMLDREADLTHVVEIRLVGRDNPPADWCRHPARQVSEGWQIQKHGIGIFYVARSACLLSLEAAKAHQIERIKRRITGLQAQLDTLTPEDLSPRIRPSDLRRKKTFIWFPQFRSEPPACVSARMDKCFWSNRTFSKKTSSVPLSTYAQAGLLKRL